MLDRVHSVSTSGRLAEWLDDAHCFFVLNVVAKNSISDNDSSRQGCKNFSRPLLVNSENQQQITSNLVLNCGLLIGEGLTTSWLCYTAQPWEKCVLNTCELCHRGLSGGARGED